MKKRGVFFVPPIGSELRHVAGSSSCSVIRLLPGIVSTLIPFICIIS